MSSSPTDERIQETRSRVTWMAMVILTVIVFLLDLVFPLGVAAGVPYITVVFLALWLPKRSSVVIAAIVTTLCTIIGFIIPWPTNMAVFWLGLENRVIALLAQWTIAILGLQLARRTEELQSANQRAFRIERLAAIGETLAVLSHESRNELNAIQLGMELLRRQTADLPDARSSLDTIRTSAKRLQVLFEDVRSFAAPVTLQLSKTNLTAIWQGAWKSIQDAHRDREIVLDEPSTAAIECQVDGFRIEQVFRNLFENAVAAGTDPVRLTLSASFGRFEGQRAVIVVVHDNGPGLPAEIRNKVFEPFFTTKSKGTGLGLAISRRIVEAHGGVMTLAEADRGAKFVITLPVGL